MFKRVALFLATNLAVLALVSIVMAIFGIDPATNAGLLMFAAVFGFGGAFVSLALSKWSAKRATGAHVITQPRNEGEQWLLATVQKQARDAGIGMPEVAIYDAPEINAFATGARRDNSLVAVSTGLLRSMSRDEAEAVLAHEVAHVANGDMVTLTLIQGVVNTFVIFLSRVVGYFVDRVLLKNDRGAGVGFYVSAFICEIIFGVLASIIVAWFSRQREYRADAGSAALLGSREPMIRALARLGGMEPGALPKNFEAAGISGGKAISALFASHPPINARIHALQSLQRV